MTCPRCGHPLESHRAGEQSFADGRPNVPIFMCAYCKCSLKEMPTEDRQGRLPLTHGLTAET